MRNPWLTELEDLLDTELRDGALDDPFRPAVLRWAASTGRPTDHDAVLTGLEKLVVAGRGSGRFRWRTPVGRWIAPERLGRWRPAEAELAQRHPNEYASRLWLAPILVEHLAWLSELAAGQDGARAIRARAIVDEAVPAVEDIVAASVGGTDPWADTFLLWTFARQPRALAPLRGLVLALAARYAARAGRCGGPVHGRTFPFFDTPMTSATAHLATAASQLGEGMHLVDEQLAWLGRERRSDGGWGDPRQGSDLLTTLATARLLGSIDPSFDPSSAVDALRSAATAHGPRPILIGPEWPWVAVELARYLEWAIQPFTERFRWPNVAPSVMDQRVGVPRFEGYLAVADLFNAVPSLGSGRVDVAFIDLANFGKWNTDHGQAAGDELLAFLTAELRTVDGSRTFRDGGDEFLLVGTPGTDDLEQRLRDLFAAWPDLAHGRFPGMPVVPLRAVIGWEPANDLRAARERQGVAIGSLKHDHPTPPDEGVIVRYDG